MTSKLSNIAVLIDADNASAKNIERILTEIEKIGVIGCKKIYGDWGSVHIKSWQEALLKYAIEPMQQFAYVKGKNATDIGMVIEAMDLLHSNVYDGFCLVSSDSDFTSLAVRIRKNNIKVFGFGKKNTVDSFTHACDRFFYVEDLVQDKANNKNLESKSNNTKASKSDGQSKPWGTRQLLGENHLINVINNLIKDDPKKVEGWSDISHVAKAINQNHTNIQLDKYGYAKFSDLIHALKLYDVKRSESRFLIKIKTKKNKVPQTSNSKQKQSNEMVKNEVDNNRIILASSIRIEMTTDLMIDAVLFRLTKDNLVRGDEDMIFYGQTHSEDNSIILNQQEQAGKSVIEFECNLGAQSSQIEQLVLVLATELEAMQSHQNFPIIELDIFDYNNALFTGQFDISQKAGKSLILCSILRENSDWRIKPIHQSVNNDLAQICEQYGIEISDD